MKKLDMDIGAAAILKQAIVKLGELVGLDAVVVSVAKRAFLLDDNGLTCGVLFGFEPPLVEQNFFVRYMSQQKYGTIRANVSYYDWQDYEFKKFVGQIGDITPNYLEEHPVIFVEALPTRRDPISISYLRFAKPLAVDRRNDLQTWDEQVVQAIIDSWEDSVCDRTGSGLSATRPVRIEKGGLFYICTFTPFINMDNNFHRDTPYRIRFPFVLDGKEDEDDKEG